MEGLHFGALLLIAVCACLSVQTAVATSKRNAAFCELEVDAGNCDRQQTRYYYDSSTDTCQTFTFGGCGGNRNNFRTEQACEFACSKTSTGRTLQSRCEQPVEVGKCQFFRTRYFYNTTSGACESFSFGGCQGNSNNFRSYQACMNLCQQD